VQQHFIPLPSMGGGVNTTSLTTFDFLGTVGGSSSDAVLI
jgi:hypothetical protein